MLRDTPSSAGTDRRLFLKLAALGALLSPIGTGGVAARHLEEDGGLQVDGGRAMSRYLSDLRRVGSEFGRLERPIDDAIRAVGADQDTLADIAREVEELVDLVETVEESLDEALDLDLDDDDDLAEFDDLKETIQDSMDDAIILLLDARETLEREEDDLNEIEEEFNEQADRVSNAVDDAVASARAAQRTDLTNREEDAVDSSLAALRDAGSGLRGISRAFFREEYGLARELLEQAVEDVDDAIRDVSSA